MMKLQIVSDLHLEFSMLNLSNKTDADVLVLAGDIFVADYFNRGEASPYHEMAHIWHNWLKELAPQYKDVVYVMGNHEHYAGRLYETYGTLLNALSDIPNLTILDNKSMMIGDKVIYGGTLWTNLRDYPLDAMAVKDGLNDYYKVQGREKGRKLSIAETSREHFKFLDGLGCPDIVVSHHLPSFRSVATRYHSGRFSNLNRGYYSDLDRIIEDSDIKLWIHGHTHDSYDYTIGDTRIVCNPRGYQKAETLPAENHSFNPNFTVEV